MFYRLLKIYARFAIRVYCSRIIINQPAWIRSKGPLLLAANHPASFLDGIIVSTLLDQNVYSLARGDAFKKPWMNKFLRYLHMLPVYRNSEGPENLEHNYTTFAACIERFKKNGIVLIFSEGSCENEWHLRPLRKGTARLATSAWESGIPLMVVPLGINYSSFKRFGKEVHLNFGDPFDRKAINHEESYGKQLLQFNGILHKGLSESVYEIPVGDQKKIENHFPYRPSRFQRIIFFFPAMVGVLLHFPLYLLAKGITEARFRNSVHYDGILVSILVLAYPFYLILLVILVNQLYPLAGWSLLLASPMSLLAFSKLNFSF